MSHHSRDLPEFMQEEAKRLGLGATGQFPRGKIHECDEGEIRVAIAADVKAQRIIMNFGKSISFIAMTEEEALSFARCLEEKALELKGILP